MIHRDWDTVPGPELRHRYVTDLRVLPGGRYLRLEVYDRTRRLPAMEVRTLDGQTITLPAIPAPAWVHLAQVLTLDSAYHLGVSYLLALDMREDARIEIEHRQRDEARGVARDRDGDRDEVQELRRRLDDPARIVAALGIGRGARRQAGRGLLVVCPAPDHSDRTPSCSVRVGRDGTIACRCHGCGWTADVLGLVAVVHRLSLRHDFQRVLARAAEIAGLTLTGRAS